MKVLRINGAKLLLLFAAIPAIVMLVLIHHYAVNVPVTDQYAFIPIFQALDHGHIPFGAFWAQHNEHRIFFPNLILVSMARLTHWNILAEVYLSFLTACATFYALLTLMRKLTKSRTRQVIIILSSALIFFSPAQWENWIWGWQFEWFLCVACIVWTIKIIDGIAGEAATKRLILPGIVAFVATFSLGSGILAWLGGLIVMVTKRHKISHAKAWIAAALLNAALYYYHYHKPDNGLSATDFISHPAAFIKQLFVYVGRPVSSDAKLALFVGIYIMLIYCILLVFIIYKKKVVQAAPAISLSVIGIVVGLMTGAARFDYGVAGALQSRYTAFSELILISVLMLAVVLVPENKSKRANSRLGAALAMISIVVLFTPALLYSWWAGLSGMRARSQSDRYIYTCSRQDHPTEACLYAIYFPSTTTALEDLNYLKQRHYGGY